MWVAEEMGAVWQKYIIVIIVDSLIVIKINNNWNIQSNGYKQICCLKMSKNLNISEKH